MPAATKRLFAPVVIFLSLIAVVAVGGLVLSGVVLAQQDNVSPVTNIAVCSGPQAGEVIVSWDAVPSATYYRIGYVNMVKDYPRAKASATGEWLEAFIYVDVNARNIPVTGGRGQYTLRRLVQGDRHAFTVLTSNNVVNTVETISGQYSWPPSPGRWSFHTVTNPDPACSASAPPAARPTPTATATATPRPTATPTRTPAPIPNSNSVPSRPANVDVRRSGQNFVVDWDASLGATHYEVWRCDTYIADGCAAVYSGWERIASRVTATTYTDTDPPVSTLPALVLTIYYYVQACNQVGCSGSLR